VQKAFLGTKQVYGPSVSTGIALYVTPASGNFSNGSTVQFQIRVDSQATDINVVQADITYPTSRLTFQSIDRTGSPLTTAIQSEGGGGQVKLGVGILGGTTSGDQLVATITFTASGNGTATIAFANTSGVAAAGVNVLEETTGATYTIS
jgi:hypothetical protein